MSTAKSDKAAPTTVPKGAELADAKNPSKADLTTFDEDDDPKSLAGDFVDENGNGVNDKEEQS